MVLEQGALSGKYDTQHPMPEGSARAETYNPVLDKLEVLNAELKKLADKYNVGPAQIPVAWLLTKVTSPVVGATKFHHIEGAAKAVNLELSGEELAYLEEPYVPHPLAGVMAQNKPSASKEKHVWSTGDQKIVK